MKIIVVGGGVVGSAIISVLRPEGHDISLIDTNPESLRQAAEDYDILEVVGSAINKDRLKEAGVENCDLLIATTNLDEMNLLACVMAKKLGAKACVARVRDPEMNGQLKFMRDDLGINRIVNPEFITAQHLSRMLRIPAATHVESFANGRIDMVEMVVPEGSVIDGVALKNLNSKVGGEKVLVCAVEREKETVIPDGEFVLRAGDKIHFTAGHEQISAFFRQVGVTKTRIRNVMLIGGGRIAYYLARMLTESGMNVKIIEKDNDRCKTLAKILPKASVISGDGANQDLLLDEGIADFDACVTLTENDANNIIISLFAKTKEVPKIITKENSSDLRRMAIEAGLASHVTPRELIADVILSYVRGRKNSKGGAMVSMVTLVNGSIEALEFVAAEDGKTVGKPLSKLGLKKGILIAGIFRDGKTRFPSGSDTIEPGDNVIVVTTNRHITSLDQIID